LRKASGFNPAYMIDQSHNVTDPIESLMQSAIEILRAYVQASLVDRNALSLAQAESDVLGGHLLIKQAFITDVSPILAEARRRKAGAVDPIGVYRASGYRNQKAQERPASTTASAGIV
jgi:L-rhamnose isomerase / sugar isomerase